MQLAPIDFDELLAIGVAFDVAHDLRTSAESMNGRLLYSFTRRASRLLVILSEGISLARDSMEDGAYDMPQEAALTKIDPIDGLSIQECLIAGVKRNAVEELVLVFLEGLKGFLALRRLVIETEGTQTRS